MPLESPNQAGPYRSQAGAVTVAAPSFGLARVDPLACRSLGVFWSGWRCFPRVSERIAGGGLFFLLPLRQGRVRTLCPEDPQRTRRPGETMGSSKGFLLSFLAFRH